MHSPREAAVTGAKLAIFFKLLVAEANPRSDSAANSTDVRRWYEKLSVMLAALSPSAPLHTARRR